jgi:trehalose 6-phosphate phosphatase
MRSGGLIERVAGARALVVATDFDGTISPIVAHPGDARAAPGALAALAALGARPGATVVVASGRPLVDLRPRVRGAGRAWLVAEHGAEIEDPSGVAMPAVDPPPSERLDALVASGARVAAVARGARVERKAFGVALHLRGVTAVDEARARGALDAWREEARAAGLSILDGRRVVEAHAPVDKATALERVLAAVGDGALPLVAGDDTTDEPALALARARGGVAVYVASSERPRPGVDVDVRLAGPREWVAWLATIAARRAG